MRVEKRRVSLALVQYVATTIDTKDDDPLLGLYKHTDLLYMYG